MKAPLAEVALTVFQFNQLTWPEIINAEITADLIIDLCVYPIYSKIIYCLEENPTNNLQHFFGLYRVSWSKHSQRRGAASYVNTDSNKSRSVEILPWTELSIYDTRLRFPGVDHSLRIDFTILHLFLFFFKFC